MEASVESFVFVAKVIDDNWRLKNQPQFPEDRIFSRTEINFLGKLRKTRKRNAKKNPIGI